MSTSALQSDTSALLSRRDDTIVFLVGRYFAMGPDKLPDHNGITRNIEAAVEHSVRLWRKGFLVFTPHLNTHHFEAKTRIDPDPIENEEYYRAFDRKLLLKAVKAVYAIPNWRESSGGRLEIQLANHLDKPVFEGLSDIESWADGSENYSTVRYQSVSPAAVHFGEGKDLPIAMVDGPYWRQDSDGPDVPAIRGNAAAAEDIAVSLFNNRFGCFTPQLNVSYERFGIAIKPDRYDRLNRLMLERVADCVVLSHGWRKDPSVLDRIAFANRLDKPVFADIEDAKAWRDGDKDACRIVIAR